MKLYKITGIIVLVLSGIFAAAQCPESISTSQLKPGMFVCGTMKGESKLYVAEIITAGSKDFIAEFLHSRSAYSFDNLKQTADNKSFQVLVESNVGGKFKKGTPFDFAAFVAHPDGCNFKMETDFGPESCISTFPDGKSYLGFLTRKNGVLSINYLHSNSIYTFSNEWRIKTVKNGTYNVGEKVTTVFAAVVELNAAP